MRWKCGFSRLQPANLSKETQAELTLLLAGSQGKAKQTREVFLLCSRRSLRRAACAEALLRAGPKQQL